MRGHSEKIFKSQSERLNASVGSTTTTASASMTEGKIETPSTLQHTAPPFQEHAVETSDEDSVFEITVDRSTGRSIGISVIRAGEVLEIETVNGGLIQEWNEKNPDKQVKAGDHIKQANGISGAVGIFGELQRDKSSLQLKIQHHVDSKVLPGDVKVGDVVISDAGFKGKTGVVRKHDVGVVLGPADDAKIRDIAVSVKFPQWDKVNIRETDFHKAPPGIEPPSVTTTQSMTTTQALRKNHGAHRSSEIHHEGQRTHGSTTTTVATTSAAEKETAAPSKSSHKVRKRHHEESHSRAGSTTQEPSAAAAPLSLDKKSPPSHQSKQSTGSHADVASSTTKETNQSSAKPVVFATQNGGVPRPMEKPDHWHALDVAVILLFSLVFGLVVLERCLSQKRHSKRTTLMDLGASALAGFSSDEGEPAGRGLGME
jgi:hypothetical protein